MSAKFVALRESPQGRKQEVGYSSVRISIEYGSLLNGNKVYR